MKNEYHKVINPHFIIWVAFLLLFCTLALFELKNLLLILSGIFLLVFKILFTPYCYIFDRAGISICYPLFPNAHYLWKEVYSIKETTVKHYIGHKNILLNYMYRKRFELIGISKKRFYAANSIIKTKKTKAMLEIYWNEKIQ